MKRLLVALIFALGAGSVLAQGPTPQTGVKEVTLTEAQSTKLELVAQKTLNASQEMRILELRFQQLQQEQARLKADFETLLADLCKAAKLDPKTTKPTQDFKKLVGPEAK